MTRRKHWYEIYAWANGYEIEQDEDHDGCWTKVDYPTFIDSWRYRVVPDSEGWLPWYGGECPVGEQEKVEITINSYTGPFSYFTLGWYERDWTTEKHIIAYRIIKETDKPKTKKVKLLAYLTDNSLTLVREGRGILSDWERVPAEDKEVEL